jgi:hypothetical protein
MIEHKKLTTMSSSYAFILAGKTVAGGASKYVSVLIEQSGQLLFSLIKTRLEPKL